MAQALSTWLAIAADANRTKVCAIEPISTVGCRFIQLNVLHPQQTLYIMIDALNQLQDVDNSLLLKWLPEVRLLRGRTNQPDGNPPESANVSPLDGPKQRMLHRVLHPRACAL